VRVAPMSISASRHRRPRSLACAGFVMCFGLITAQPTLADDSDHSVAGTIQDYTPDHIEIEITRVGSTALETIKRGTSLGRGTSLYIGDTLSIAKWCKQNKNRSGSVAVNVSSGEVHLDCNKHKYYIFTKPLPSSYRTNKTDATITTENPGAAPIIAVSPYRSSEDPRGQPAKAKDLLRKGEGLPSAEGASKSAAPR
jgi:hypothetical protein